MQGVPFARNARAISPLFALLVAFPARGDHPMLTEDTGVLGAGVWEIELHGERARDRQGAADVRSAELTLRLARGLTEKLQLQVELPYVREAVNGSAVDGRGDGSVSAKWRLHDGDGLSFAFKPDVVLPTGRDELGLGAGRVRWAVNALAAYERASFELIAHLGYTRNRNRVGERVELWHGSVALRWAATEKLKLVADLGRDSNPDPAARSAGRELVYGLMYALRDNVELGIG